MKNTKQLLIAAVAASMSLNAMADITISGEAKVNAKGGDYHIETDLTIIGKSGDTSIIAQLGLDNNNVAEQLYMTSKVAGVDVKLGYWYKEKGELDQKWNTSDGGYGYGDPLIIKASTTFGGVDLAYQDFSGPGGTKVSVSGKIGGFETMLKKHTHRTEAKVSGAIGGIDIDAHVKDYETGDLDSSVTLKTSVQGLDFTYVNTTSEMGTRMDGFIGKQIDPVITEANAFGASANILGNKITYKDIMINGVDSQKLILTRKIASGTTFEATYRDIEEGVHTDLDLELAVKF